MRTLLLTGFSGLIGSEVCAYFARELGYSVHGVDNNQRTVFFGPQGIHAGTSNACNGNFPVSFTMNSIFATGYPKWDITKSLEQTIQEIVKAWRNRSAAR